jgi:excisionase family DNA binding protein
MAKGNNQTAVGEVQYLTAKQAASYIGASINYFYKLTSGHKLPYYNPTGRKLLFKRSELDAWIEAARVPTDDELEAKVDTAFMMKGGRA